MRTGVSAAVVALVAACVGTGFIPTRGERTALAAHAMQVPAHDPEWLAPESAAARTNPLSTRPGAEAGGRRVFQQKCAACHGQDGHGSAKAPDLTQPAVRSQTDGALFWKIGAGNTRKGMPSFSFLPEAQRWQLVLAVRSLASGDERR